jgi:hypothetical protein
MKLHALYLISGRGWVAEVTLHDGEVYRHDEHIMIGNIRWVVKGVERTESDHTHVGLQLRPERIESDHLFIEEEKTMPTHDIGYAVRLLKEGKRVTRKGWSGKNMWLALREPDLTAGDRKLSSTSMTLRYVFMKTADGQFVPWLCSQTDLLAEDWEEISTSTLCHA